MPDELPVRLALLFLAACGAAKAPPSSDSALLGKAAPAFRRDALDGSAVDIAGARGKVVVVKFVAQYCEPCKKTLPAIERLHVAHPELFVVAVSEDEREADARALAAAFGLSFPVVHDRSNVLAARYRVRELPVTYVLDGQGNVAWVGGPEKTETELVDAIEHVRR
jgi:cytochrome c biogenesis protein CcmG/thiol:disulfide interchange protein DsbE